MKRRHVTLRVFATLGVAALVTAGAAGCSGSDSATDENGNPIVTIMVVKNSNQTPMSEMTWAQELEEDCDCTIEWQEVSDDQWGQQKSATLASGDLADLNIRAFNPDDVAVTRPRSRCSATTSTACPTCRSSSRSSPPPKSSWRSMAWSPCCRLAAPPDSWRPASTS